MGGKNDAPAAPDYGPLAQASEASAKYAYQLGAQQLDWAKQQYAQDRDIVQQVVGSALDTQNANTAAAAADRQRYQNIYQPLEDTLVADAQSYASPGRRDQDMGRAAAVTAQQFDGARAAALQNLESFGVKPTSTRYAALDIGQRTAKAAAMAASANQAGQVTDATGRALRSEAINVGRGYPGQVAGTYGTALNAGRSAVDSSLASTASGANMMGTAPQWQGIGNQAINTWGDVLNQGYNNQLAAWSANQSASSGIGSLLGTVGGMAAMAYMEEGGTVPAGDATHGGAVPPAASPSRGAIPDDVPARLTPDEFVVPRDVLKWKGEEFFQKMIKSSRDARQQAPAQARMAAIPAGQAAGAPAFSSRPVGAGALPVR